MTKIKIAVQHVQTIEQEKKPQSKSKQMYTYNIIQKCEKKTNKQSIKLLLLLNTDNNIYIYMKKNNQFSKIIKMIY